VRWLEVTLSVDAELAEAVADWLSKFAPHGVILQTERVEEGSPPSLTEVRAYMPQDDNLKQRVADLETGLWHLGQIRSLPDPAYREVADEDWSEAWKASYRPLAVGQRLQIVPAWLEAPAGDRLTLWMDPGMAFGTGSHPTTRLCMEALEAWLRPGEVVADLGCGSGILSFAAAALGARRVFACDIDPLAIEATRSGAVRNGVAETVEVFEGSLDELGHRLRSAGLAPDLLLANLLESTLLDLLPRGLGDTVRPGGRLVVSGLLAEQTDRVSQAAEDRGLRPLDVLAEGDWRALVLESPPPPAMGAARDTSSRAGSQPGSQMVAPPGPRRRWR
jgi:ribosomal protein L11 methyltransferase